MKNSGFPHLDYGARYYHPLSSRWTTLDPLAEKYYSVSPYAFCSGNPVNFAIKREQNGLAHFAEREQRKALQGLNFVDVDDMRWMDKNGQLAWTSGNWTQYASDLHKEVGNTLLMTITGRAQFNELVDSVSIIL